MQIFQGQCRHLQNSSGRQLRMSMYLPFFFPVSIHYIYSFSEKILEKETCGQKVLQFRPQRCQIFNFQETSFISYRKLVVILFRGGLISLASALTYCIIRTNQLENKQYSSGQQNKTKTYHLPNHSKEVNLENKTFFYTIQTSDSTMDAMHIPPPSFQRENTF